MTVPALATPGSCPKRDLRACVLLLLLTYTEPGFLHLTPFTLIPSLCGDPFRVPLA
jgi:hypothetical protein